MSEDGRIDYSRYSREDLLQVLDQIDGERYPLNLKKARDELARRPEVTAPPPRKVLSKRERAAAALTIDICADVIVQYMALLLMLTFAFEVVARWADLPEEARGAWSLLPVLCSSILLASRSPRGFYVNASIIVLGNIAFWTLLSLGSPQAFDGISVLSSLFWSLCTVSVSGLLCGLWPIGGQRSEDA